MSNEEPDVKTLSFEQAMKALEEVVGQLEHGDVALDRSIALYERGAALKARCASLLKEAEERVEKITLGADGSVQGTAPVDGT
ncbi:exodeoxyribonuclease VII small subunit [Thioclava sp. BHET1]|uniref:Exodeoxyribonuclease 7 small subunit n=1 Tax=Thioclava dalianensis TaxID=1185766 RepID=A0A074THX5_9RHOB|nr:exodeoxyribonuclease VII small subunit [Thioclava dalianensis]KEP69735.1 exodeoxyribonuclease VII small subunit [Thioclava dalianensis]TMV94595.1 exodeoxyribonuclease VII small subunit [Thioclava sp. BHET1]SFM93821.1 Exodeoxyribonuclease VII small subunit [Thioclava dalianensis]